MAYPFGSVAIHKAQPPVAGTVAPTSPKDNAPKSTAQEATSSRPSYLPSTAVHPIHGKGRWMQTPPAPITNTPEGRALALARNSSIFSGPKPAINSRQRAPGPCTHCGGPENHLYCGMYWQPEDSDGKATHGIPNQDTQLPSTEPRSVVGTPALQTDNSNRCIPKKPFWVPRQDYIDQLKQTLKSLSDSLDFTKNLAERPGVSQIEKDTFAPVIRETERAIELINLALSTTA